MKSLLIFSITFILIHLSFAFDKKPRDEVLKILREYHKNKLGLDGIEQVENVQDTTPIVDYLEIFSPIPSSSPELIVSHHEASSESHSIPLLDGMGVAPSHLPSQPVDDELEPNEEIIDETSDEQDLS